MGSSLKVLLGRAEPEVDGVEEAETRTKAALMDRKGCHRR